VATATLYHSPIVVYRPRAVKEVETVVFLRASLQLRRDMWFIDLTLHVVVGTVAAVAGQFLTGKAHGGCLLSVLAGVAGAYAGPWAAERMEWVEPYFLPVGDVQFPVVTAVAGAFVFAVITSLLTRKRKL